MRIAFVITAMVPALAWSTQASAQASGTSSAALPSNRNESPALEGLAGSDIEDVALEDLLNVTVTTATKSDETLRESPAVVTVITADEILSRGATSIADVLRTVPGFYDVYDLVTHNFGVRGINAGVRASGSVVKLMIDGHPVQFRSSTGNFYGEELLPIEAIDRIEIIRGPASALYGSNAFLGVVNVITKPGSAIHGMTLVGQAGAVQENFTYGGGLVAGGSTETVDVLLSLHRMRIDRSGLPVPDQSPILDRMNNPLTGGRTESLRDRSNPQTLFAKMSVGALATSRLTVWGSIQNLDANGEFTDFDALTHRTRISLINQNYGLVYEYRPNDWFGVTGRAGFFNSHPSDSERISVGRNDVEFRRDVHVDGFDLGLEADGKWKDVFSWRAGVDYLIENNTLQSYDSILLTDVVASDGTVLRPAGSVLPGQGSGRTKRFTNLGVYLQGIYTIDTAWSATAGIRVDHHNIYDTYFSPRTAIVFAPKDESYYGKLLFGTSFKAPTAEQLFTQPLQDFDLRGNSALKAQTAQTLELAGGYGLGEWGQALANVYVTRVEGLVEFNQRGLFLEAENASNKWITGGEIEARIKPIDGLRLQIGIGYAYTLSTSDQNAGVIIGALDVQQPLFPTLQGHLVAEYRLPWLASWDLRVTPELSYIAPREASQSNALERGSSYDLPAFVYTAFSLSSQKEFGGFGKVTARLRATNLLDEQHPEPGFGGVDVPSLGRTIWLTLSATQFLGS